MKVTLEMVLTRFFAQHKEANLFSKITDTQMHHALLGIQLLPRHMKNLSADYLYVTDDQFYYSAQISRDCRKVKTRQCLSAGYCRNRSFFYCIWLGGT